MTIECYFRWCRWHHQDEPFCHLSECKATSTEIDQFREWREDELLKDNSNDQGDNKS